MQVPVANEVAPAMLRRGRGVSMVLVEKLTGRERCSGLGQRATDQRFCRTIARARALFLPLSLFLSSSLPLPYAVVLASVVKRLVFRIVCNYSHRSSSQCRSVGRQLRRSLNRRLGSDDHPEIALLAGSADSPVRRPPAAVVGPRTRCHRGVRRRCAARTVRGRQRAGVGATARRPPRPC